MGERNKSTKATVLSIKKSGENNRSVLFISPDEGLFYATLFGGPKSKLKSLIQNFYSGTLWLYEDEVKKTRKITDFSFSLICLSDKKYFFEKNVEKHLTL